MQRQPNLPTPLEPPYCWASSDERGTPALHADSQVGQTPHARGPHGAAFCLHAFTHLACMAVSRRSGISGRNQILHSPSTWAGASHWCAGAAMSSGQLLVLQLDIGALPWLGRWAVPAVMQEVCWGLLTALSTRRRACSRAAGQRQNTRHPLEP